MNLSHKWTKKTTQDTSVRPRSFFRTLLFSLLTVSILATVIPSFCLTIDYMRSSVTVSAEFNQNLLSQTNFAIAQMNDSVARLTNTLYSDPEIISFLYMKNNDSRTTIQASRILDKQLVTLPFIESVYLYNGSLDLFFSSKTGEQTLADSFLDRSVADLISDKDFIASNGKTPVPTKFNSDSSKASTISYFHFDPAASKGDRINAIVVNVSPSSLTSSIRSMNQYPDGIRTNFVVMNEKGQVISSILNSDLEESDSFYSGLSEALRSGKTPGRFFTADGTRYLMSYTKDNVNSWYLISLIPVTVIFRNLIASAIFAVLITVAVLLLCFAACYYFARRLNTPVQAITRILKGDKTEPLAADLQGTEEFQMILTSFQSMQEQNQQFDRMKRESSYSARKDFLNNLTTGNSTDSAETTAQKLRQLNLSYLLEDSLCMVVFKIDGYSSFCSDNNPKELWLLRFAIVNIMEEISARGFTADVFSRDNDKFVILIDVKEDPVFKTFCVKLEEMIREIQKNVSEYLHFSLTAAYSTLFREPDHIPRMFANMEDSLLMQIKYGHNSIISPYMVDEIETGAYEVPLQEVEKLITLINSGAYEQTHELFQQIVGALYQYDYNEIISGTIHLAYSIYTRVRQKYPERKEANTALLKECLAALQNVELTSDIDRLMDHYIHSLCQSVLSIREMAAEQDTNSIAPRICRIIEEQYMDLSLCLSSIAEEIGLTPNYAGRLFKSFMQVSVAQYILDFRMEKLAEYLENSNLPLNVMLEKVGIEKSNYFYTQFKKHFGMSLMEYKQKKGFPDTPTGK